MAVANLTLSVISSAGAAEVAKVGMHTVRAMMQTIMRDKIFFMYRASVIN